MPVKPGNVFTTLRAIKKAMAEIPTLAGAEALRFFKQNFALQGWQGEGGLEAWAARKDTTNTRPLLTGTGPHVRLRNSLQKNVTQNKIWVGVMGPATKYADTHNFGAVIKIAVTAKMKRWAWAMYYATYNARYRAIALQPVGKVMTIKVPKRHFIGDNELLNKKLMAIAEKRIAKAAGLTSNL